MMSSYAVKKTMNAWLRGEEFTLPDKVYLGLLKKIPTMDSASGEVSGGGYKRVEISFSEATDGGWCMNDEEVVFAEPTEDWADEEEPIVAVAIFDSQGSTPQSQPEASSESGDDLSGNYLFADILCEPLVVLSGDPPPEIDVGGIKAAIGDCGWC